MLKLVAKVLTQPVCDHCLGRQFAQLLSGMDNAQRGAALRTALALALDGGFEYKVDLNNFYDFKFRSQKLAKAKKEKKRCEICCGLFGRLEKIAQRVVRALSKYEFKTFLVGTRISQDLLEREERLWTELGIDYCEPIRAEINRELGKLIERLSGKRADLKMPDIAVLLDLEKNQIKLDVRSLYIFGYYKKLKRGFPQCKWTKYKTSVEQEIARALLKASRASGHKFHGAGREDVDARCLAWRPFVLELLRPRIRSIKLRNLQAEINKSSKVKVSRLKFCDAETVRKVKSAAPQKEYRALVILSKPIKRSQLKSLSKLKTIMQRTPSRVLHRRADLVRRRKVLSLRTKYISPRRFELFVRTEAGLYIKELVSGDNGRTRPSVSELLGVPAHVKELDVIKIFAKNI